jgi:hypothetical protein
MDVRKNLIPVDLVDDLEPFIDGDYGYERQVKFSSDPINILDGAYLLLDESSDFFSESATYSFWFDSDLVEEVIDIFSIHDNSEGVSLSYSTQESKFIVGFYGSSSVEEFFEISEPVLITFAVLNGNLSFYVNDEVLLTTSSFSIPGTPEITLGSLENLEGLGQSKISDFFYLQYGLSQVDIENLYSLGFEGYENFSLDSSSSISLADVDNDFLQTAWQAYGEVTTKQ